MKEFLDKLKSIFITIGKWLLIIAGVVSAFFLFFGDQLSNVGFKKKLSDFIKEKLDRIKKDQADYDKRQEDIRKENEQKKKEKEERDKEVNNIFPDLKG